MTYFKGESIMTDLKDLKDDDMIEEIKRRFKAKDELLCEFKVITKKLKDMNDKLIESERIKSLFISNIRNEINNPLTSLIILSYDLVDACPVDHPKWKKVARMVLREAQSLDFQIRNVLLAAELESGQTILDNLPTDLDSLIENCLRYVSESVDEKEIKVKVEYGEGWLDDKHIIFTDPQKMNLIVLNLLDNAVKFNKQGGNILIKLEMKEGNFVFSIRDEGIGIDRKYHKVIFDGFKQLSSGSTKEYRGNGLGLAVTRLIVELYGGKLELESEVDKGSTFSFYVPTSQFSSLTSTNLDEVAVGGDEFLFDSSEVEEF
jgi:signal transduction histidine kinase